MSSPRGLGWGFLVESGPWHLFMSLLIPESFCGFKAESFGVDCYQAEKNLPCGCLLWASCDLIWVHSIYYFYFILTSWIVLRRTSGVYDETSSVGFYLGGRDVPYRGRGVNACLGWWPRRRSSAGSGYLGPSELNSQPTMPPRPAVLPHLFPSPHPTESWKMSFFIFLLPREELDKKRWRNNSFVQKYGNHIRGLQHLAGVSKEKNPRCYCPHFFHLFCFFLSDCTDHWLFPTYILWGQAGDSGVLTKNCRAGNYKFIQQTLTECQPCPGASGFTNPASNPWALTVCLAGCQALYKCYLT